MGREEGQVRGQPREEGREVEEGGFCAEEGRRCAVGCAGVVLGADAHGEEF